MPRPLPTLPRPLRNLLAGLGLTGPPELVFGLRGTTGLELARALPRPLEALLDVLDAWVDRLADLGERLDDEVVGDLAAVDEVLDRLVAGGEGLRVLGRAGAGLVVEVALGLHDPLARPLGDRLRDGVRSGQGRQAEAGFLGRAEAGDRVLRLLLGGGVAAGAAGTAGAARTAGPTRDRLSRQDRRGCPVRPGCRARRSRRDRRRRPSCCRPCRRRRSGRPCRSPRSRSCRRGWRRSARR